MFLSSEAGLFLTNIPIDPKAFSSKLQFQERPGQLQQSGDFMKNYLVILLGIMLVWCWVIVVQAKQKTSPITTLTIAMALEPDNLYIYDGTSLNEQNIQQAIMDGPVDNRGYTYQPVILEKLPSFHDGDAITKTVIVQTGEPYISPSDEIIIANAPISATQLFVTYTLKSNVLWADV